MRPVPLLAALLLVPGCQSSPTLDICSDFHCSNHGQCILVDDSSGHPTPTCLCDTGYTPDSSGWLCESKADDSLCAGVTCSGHGSCVSVQGKGSCKCDAGYKPGADGKSCENPCLGQTCSGHGTCKSGDKGLSCDCSLGYRASADGLSCLPTFPGTLHVYKLTYTTSTWVMGTATLDLSDLAQGRLNERMKYSLYYDSWRGLRHTVRQDWTLDSTGKGVTAMEMTDLFMQAELTRTRHSSATFANNKVTATLRRLDKQGAYSTSYSGTLSPIPMPGGFEYPGWTMGCYSPAFYMLAFQRYDSSRMGTQEVDVYWPSFNMVSRIKVTSDAKWTAGRPALHFPEYNISVVYDESGIPLTIQANRQNIVWTRYSGTPADLNLPTLEAATPVTPTPLPTDIKESAVTFTSQDSTKLAGTLTLPQSKTTALPAVLMVSDIFGADQDAPLESLPHARLYKHLAAHLAHAGYASLRYDPRSRGLSGGDLWSVTPAKLAEDAAAALAQLKGTTGVDASRIYLLSHGRSSVPAITLLGTSTSIKGYIGLAPVLQKLDQEVVYQATTHLTASKFSSKFVDKQKTSYQSLVKSLQAGSYNNNTWWNLPLAFWKSWLAFDGTTTLDGFKGPVLLLRGDQDMEISDAQLKAAVAAAATSGKKNLTTKTLTTRTFLLSAGEKKTLWESALLPFEVPADTQSEILTWLSTN